MREGFIRQVEIRIKLGQHVTGLGTSDGKLRPLFGDRGDKNLVVGPLRLQPFFEPGRNTIRSARSRVHQEVVIGQANRHAIIRQKTQLVHHQAITTLADFQGREHVGVNSIKECGGVRSLDFNFAQRRGVQQPHFIPYTEDFPCDRRLLVFANAGIGIGPSPLAHGFKYGSTFRMPVENGCLANGQEQVACQGTCNGAEGKRRVGRAECGDANFRNGFSGGF